MAELFAFSFRSSQVSVQSFLKVLTALARSGAHCGHRQKCWPTREAVERAWYESQAV